MGDKPAGNPTTSTQPGRQMKRSGRQMKGSGRQASREPDHKHRAWETNEKNWETNKRKWETSRPGTRPDHPAPRRPFFKALRTPNSKLFGEQLPMHRPRPLRRVTAEAGGKAARHKAPEELAQPFTAPRLKPSAEPRVTRGSHQPVAHVREDETARTSDVCTWGRMLKRKTEQFTCALENHLSWR